MKMPFGQYKGKELEELTKAYLGWLLTITLLCPKKCGLDPVKCRQLEKALAAERLLQSGPQIPLEPSLYWMLQLIRAGSNALALKHHPDDGGSGEIMREIIAARNQAMFWCEQLKPSNVRKDPDIWGGPGEDSNG